jgi:hypothetical protein
VTNPHQRTIDALKQVIDHLEQENDPFVGLRNKGFPEKLFHEGIWYWDGGEMETLTFIDDPSHAEDYLWCQPEDVEPYHVILIPAREDEL